MAESTPDNTFFNNKHHPGNYWAVLIIDAGQNYYTDFGRVLFLLIFLYHLLDLVDYVWNLLDKPVDCRVCRSSDVQHFYNAITYSEEPDGVDLDSRAVTAAEAAAVIFQGHIASAAAESEGYLRNRYKRCSVRSSYRIADYCVYVYHFFDLAQCNLCEVADRMSVHNVIPFLYGLLYYACV